MISCRTGKIMFHSIKDAKAALRQQKACRKATKHPAKHYYHCEFCGGYHLTSKSKGQVKLNSKKKALMEQRMAFTALLTTNNTVTWFLANQVKWMHLRIVNDATVLAVYAVHGVDKYVVLRNI